MKRNRTRESVNAGSMADIAFLLLIFFLVTTTIVQDKGIMITLPPRMEEEVPPVEQHDRNLFKILINSQDELLVENELREDLSGLREEIKEFVLNRGQNPNLSDSPVKAIVSIKSNKGTSYGRYIHLLDEVKAAYYEIYGDRVGLSAKAYRELDLSAPDQKQRYEAGKDGIPMNISIANPD